LWKEVNGVKTYFVYADEGLVAEVDAAGNVVKSYGYRPGSTWTTDPLFMRTDGQYYFYQNDHLGTPQKLTAVNGAVIWSAKYSSFGQAEVNPSSTVINNLRFPGQYYDQETGLHYNYSRYYDPTTSRYLTPDPIGMAGGINFFTYVQSNPVNWYDSQGLYAIPLIEKLIEFGAPLLIGAIWYAITGNDIKIPDCGNEEDPRCPEIRRKILKHIEGMIEKYGEMLDDPLELFHRAYDSNPGGDLIGKGTWIGHVQRYEGLRVGLRRMVNEAESLGCSIPPEAYWWINNPPPTRPAY
jgi:RHS repeat-associated protein